MAKGRGTPKREAKIDDKAGKQGVLVCTSLGTQGNYQKLLVVIETEFESPGVIGHPWKTFMYDLTLLAVVAKIGFLTVMTSTDSC